MINLRMLKYSDYTLWIAALALILIGLTIILSSTASLQGRAGADQLLYVKKQLFALIVGLLFLGITTYIDYEHLERASIFLYVGIVILLLIVLIFGYTLLGAQRWLTVGFISFQPSELAKLIIIITFAAYLERREEGLKTILQLLPIFILAGLPLILIFKQPDLGTAVVIFLMLLGMLLISKGSPMLLVMLFTPFLSIFLRQHIFWWLIFLFFIAFIMHQAKFNLFDWSLILGANVGGGFVLPHIWRMLKEYQRQRLLVFFNPSLDPKGIGYHTLQSKIAIGSGGVFGKGLFHGTQTQLQFIPQQYSDFIFSAIGEELGFIGALLVLTLFGILIWRSIEIARNSKDAFGCYLGGGIAIMFTIHLAINVGMTLGLLPVVGITLPFISFGGTSLVVSLMSIGILQSIAMRSHKIFF